MLMDAINDEDTDQDTDGVETETVEEVEEVEDESTTRESQNSIGMQCVSRIHTLTHRQPVLCMHHKRVHNLVH